MGFASAALAYALQFEGTVRQWDVIGKWVKLSDKRPSLIIDDGKKWLGPMWAQIDENNIMRCTPAKTMHTSGAEVVLDLNKLPIVMDELGKVPEEARPGPLIVKPRTDYLGTQGLQKWEESCGLTPLVLWVEEAARVLAMLGENDVEKWILPMADRKSVV